LRNDLENDRHWLRFHLLGNGLNRDAIGAEVIVEYNGQNFHKTVSPTKGYLSQSETVLTFGLLSSSKVDEVTIRWPDGVRQTMHPDQINRTISVPHP